MDDRTDRPGRAGLGRDQLARAAMQLAPEALLAVLRFGEEQARGAVYGPARRLDTQAALSPYLVDGAWVQDAGTHVELWLVEMQSRAVRRRPGRALAILHAAMEQLLREGAPLDDDRAVLFEVRTSEVARSRQAVDRDASFDPQGQLDPDAASLRMATVDFAISNRLLLEGEWSAILAADPAAWPLWAFGRHAGPDAIAERIEALAPDAPFSALIAALLRGIGRVRFPRDERFTEARESQEVAMSEAAVAEAADELVASGRMTKAERTELYRRYIHDLKHSRERFRQQILAEGRKQGREALLSVVEALAPESVEALRSIEDLDALRDAVTDVLAGLKGG